ncbi:MAG TPA: hypothetical protein VF256_24035 [Streptosporangiaceae bacterium]
MGMAADGSGQIVMAYLGAGEGAGQVMRVSPVDGLFHAVTNDGIPEPGGRRDCLPAASRQVPGTPAPRPTTTSWSPANSLTLLEVCCGSGRYRQEGSTLAATVSQGGQLADPFGIAVEATAPFWLSAPPTV